MLKLRKHIEKEKRKNPLSPGRKELKLFILLSGQRSFNNLQF